MLLVVLPLCANVAYAQKSAVVLPERGSFSVEIQFNPVSSLLSAMASAFELNDGKAEIHYYLSPSTALRAGVGFSFSDNVQSNGVQGSAQASETAVSSSLGLSFGIEKHFVKYGCFDLYAGPVIGVDKHWLYSAVHAGEKLEESYFGSLNGVQTAQSGLEAALVGGVNIYVCKGLFVGAEMGFAAEYTRTSDVDHTTIVGESTITVKDKEHDSSINLGFFCCPALRIGLTF